MTNIIYPATTINQDDSDYVNERINTLTFAGNRSAFQRHLIDLDRKHAPDHIHHKIREIRAELEALEQEAQKYEAAIQIRQETEVGAQEIVDRKLDEVYGTYKTKMDGGARDQYIEGWLTGPGFEEDAASIGLKRVELQAYVEKRYTEENDGTWAPPTPEPAGPPEPCADCGGVGGHSTGCPAEGGGA